jgi:hypothetical protein
MKMNRLVWLFLSMAMAASCAHLPGGRPGENAQMWHDAHMALYARDFARADSLFTRLALAHPHTVEGREARFYSGTIYLDPRNPAWDSERAETSLRQYLQQDTVGTTIFRRPEATMLHEMARQLNLPPTDRVEALRPATPVGQAQPPARGAAPPRPVARGDEVRALQAENDRLRQQVAAQDDQIRRQREELERIRRALAPRQ